MFAKVYGPGELQIVEQAYKLARVRLALTPFPDVVPREERERELREKLFYVARRGDDAESLCEKVLALVPESWIALPSKQSLSHGDCQR